jgi:uncharacterized protein
MRDAGLHDSLLLKDYRPKSIYNIPENPVLKAKYLAIDMHIHVPRGNNLDSIVKEVLKNIDEAGVIWVNWVSYSINVQTGMPMFLKESI